MGDHITMHLFEDFSELIEKSSKKEPPCANPRNWNGP